MSELQKKVDSLLKPNPLPGGYLVPAVAPEDDPEQILCRQLLYLAQAQTLMAIVCQMILPWKTHAHLFFYSQGTLWPSMRTMQGPLVAEELIYLCVRTDIQPFCVNWCFPCKQPGCWVSFGHVKVKETSVICLVTHMPMTRETQ
jgi:hypothetical protein